MTCSCLVSQGPRDDTAIPGQTAPAPEVPPSPLSASQTPLLYLALRSHQEEDAAVGTGRLKLAFNLTPATERVSGLVVFGMTSIHKLKTARSQWD